MPGPGRGILRALMALTGLAVATALLSVFFTQPVRMGDLALWQRGAWAGFAGVSIVTGVMVLLPSRMRRFLIVPSLLGVVGVTQAWFLWRLPMASPGGIEGRQLASALITESTSNGIIEVGFAYPIYTPTIELTSRDAFTRRYQVFLRLTDAGGTETLFRAVRGTLPDERMTVEATVRGMLSRNPEYLFTPLAVGPGQVLSGRVVFIISTLPDGTTFNDALGAAYPGQFELRDPDSGDLVASFPLHHI